MEILDPALGRKVGGGSGLFLMKDEVEERFSGRSGWDG